MANALTKWFRRKKFGGGEKGGKENNPKMPPLPSLPVIRPSVLTPSPSTVSLVHAPSKSAETQLSFFDRFPFEIRRRILIEAFGDQIVHMQLTNDQLELDLSQIPKPKDPQYSPHANTPRQIQPKSKFSKSKPDNQWRWSSSVCHRATPTSIRTWYGKKLVECKCLEGGLNKEWCEFWPGEQPGKCFIGIMGWLLSCRQAYVEGIDVLYSTNTIHMARNPMMLHLPQLLLPQRLASISSVEMRWFLYPYQSGSGFEEFHLLAASLLNFTNLKSLHVSIEGKLRSTELGFPSNEMVNDVFLKPMETSIRRMPTLQRCQIELPLSLYDVKRFKIREEYVTQGYFFRKERIWRNLPKSAEEDVHLSGYWITLGHMDRNTLGPMPCFSGSKVSSINNSPTVSMIDLV